MLKKVIIPVVIIAIAAFGYRLMNSGDSKQGSNRKPTATQSENRADQAPTDQNNQHESGQKDKKDRNAGQDQKTASGEKGAPPSAEAGETESPTNEESKTDKSDKRPQRGGMSGMRSGVLAKQGATSVDVIPAKTSMTQAQINLFGVIEAQKQATILATSTSRVISINMIEGQTVTPGNSIVSLEANSAVETLQQKTSSLTELEARIRNENLKHQNDVAALTIDKELLRIAKNSVDRFNSLNAQQLSSGSDYEVALRSYQSQLLSVQNRELTLAQYTDQTAQYAAQKASLLSQIRQAKQQVDELDVSVSFNGLVAKLPVTIGQELRAGEVVAEVFDPDSLALFVRVPLRYRLDQLDLKQLTAFDSNGQHWLAQSIRPINESGAQRLTLTPAVDENIKLLPGTHVSLTVHYPLSEPAVEVPVTAVYDQQRIYLFDEGTITATDIEILGSTEKGYLIRSDAFVGRTMIVATRLKNPITGMAVSVINSARGGRQ